MMDVFRMKLKRSSCFLPRLIFRYVGVSTDGDENLLYKLFAGFILTISSTYPFNNYILLMQYSDDFDMITNSLHNIIGGTTAFLKIVVILYNRKQLGNVLNKIEKVQFEHNREKWGQRDAYSMNKLIIACFSILSFSLLYFFVGTLTKRILTDDPKEWSLPISDVAFNRTYSPNYEIAWAYQVISLSVLALSFCLSGFLVAGVIADICIQLKMLGEYFKKAINEFHIDRSRSNLDYLQEITREMVIRHVFIIGLVKEVEGTFSALILLDVLANIGMIFLAVYNASVLPLFSFAALQIYIEVFTITSSLFFTCYWGTKVELTSQAVAGACYEANFVGTGVAFQKNLVVIMMRCQKPITFSVGRFTTLSVGVFAWIIRNSYTYLMVLRKTNESHWKNG